MKHIPATPLPWEIKQEELNHPLSSEEYMQIASFEGAAAMKYQDAKYAAHAANAYPSLVEMLKGFAELDREPTPEDARALLRELGEL